MIGGLPKFSSLVDGSIESVTESDLTNVAIIRDGVFSNLNITSVEIPGNVITIGNDAFANNKISSLTLSEGIISIGENAFANNPISSLEIPTSVTNIGSGAFEGTQITELNMGAQPNPPSVTNTSFPSTLVSIYVPYGAYESYLAEWSAYADKIVRLPAIPSTITITVNNYLGEVVSGAVVTIVGNDQTFTGTTNENGVFVQGDLQPATYTIIVADIEGFKTPSEQSVEVYEDTLNNVEFTYLEKPQGVEFDRVFANNSPATISAVSAEISANNMTSAEVGATYGWKIGDTTSSIPLTNGESIVVRISGVNHDTKSDGSGTAGLMLEMTHCMSTQRPLGSSQSNKNVYKTFNDNYAKTLKTFLPQEWQDIIIPVDKKVADGGGAANYKQTLTLSSEIFLLSAKEVFGNAQLAKAGEEEGEQYEYYALGGSRIKNIKWWLRSSSNKYNQSMCFVDASGNCGENYANYGSGISFAFCV